MAEPRHVVGIYRTVHPELPGDFITEQAKNLRSWWPFFLVRDRRGSMRFEHEAISDEDPSGVKRTIFTVTRTPRFFETAASRVVLIHAHSTQDAVYGAALAEAWRVPLVVTCRGSDVATGLGSMLLSRDPAVYQYLLHRRELQRSAALFIAVSQFVADKLAAAGFPRDRIVHHHIGVDTRRFAPSREQPAERVILNVARHVPHKGLPTLLRAFARIAPRHPDVTLVQAGAGPDTPLLVQLIDELGIARQTRLLGAVPHDRVVDLMRQAELFALTGETDVDGTAEDLGIVFNEASACGLPVVATASGGIPEAVVHGETGLLAPERDERAVADHLDALLTDRARARTMGRRGRQFAHENFDIRTQTAKLERIYAGLTGC